MLQRACATDIPTAETEENVRMILRIKFTRASARHSIPASTVKLVSSHVTFLLHSRLSVCNSLMCEICVDLR